MIHPCADACRLAELDAEIKRLEKENVRFRIALNLIAAPMRPDGTYNRDRDACRILAEEALK